MRQPLADAIRPTTLDEVVGQQHLLCPGGVLRRLIENGTEANMVFYGPSGTAVSYTPLCVHAGSCSKTGMAASSMEREISALVLDFLLV